MELSREGKGPYSTLELVITLKLNDGKRPTVETCRTTQETRAEDRIFQRKSELIRFLFLSSASQLMGFMNLVGKAYP